jgi:hypothetical protein
VVAKHSSETKHSTDFNKIEATANITYIPHNKAIETATPPSPTTTSTMKSYLDSSLLHAFFFISWPLPIG